jgi:enoyl-[acyl-carrier protein] reductase I
MYTIDLSNQHALIMGVANHRSLSWSIAQCLHQAGAKLAFTYQGDRLKSMVEDLVKPLGGVELIECDVTRDEQIDAVAKQLGEKWGSVEMLLHGIAFARKEDLEGRFAATPREGFQLALEISAYSLLNVTNRLLPLLEKNGASIATLSYLASERAVPSYNVMGSAKAVLEQIVRQLAFELGPKNIRVNALSAGPVSTLASRGIQGFVGMLKAHADKAPLKRNITKEEVGKAGLFLLSDLSSGITGETLYVDAGYRIMGW